MLDSKILDQYAALIFDMDGTLIDTMPSHQKAWELTGEKLGYQVDSSVMYELGGATVYTIGREIMKRANMPEHLFEEMIALKRELSYQLTLQHSTLLPAFDVVQRYFGKKPMAVGTGSHRKLAYELLNKFELVPYFNAIVDANDVTHHKPNPETFLLCAERMEIAPNQCLVFEDADLGIQAALNAGMDVFDVRVKTLIKV